jgi:UDP-3-O-[3-hydroxymyristoyl] glucosamine N-acyltransferase
MPTLQELAGMLGAEIEGDTGLVVETAAPLESAGPNAISFVGSKKALKELAASRAGCLIVAQDFLNASGRTVLRVKDPRKAFAKVLGVLFPDVRPAAGVHETALVSATARLGEGVSVGPYSVIGEGCVVGAGTAIGAHCVVGDGVQLGEGCRLNARVTFYAGARTGARCIFHSGAVIGADGFGFVMEAGRYEKFPQVGTVVLGDDVEVGANSTIDRAALGVTTIGDGVKLDNMVHIGHNCRIGRHVVMAAQTGIGGGSVIEDYVVLGGQVGIADNVTVKAKAIVGAKTGVPSGKILKGDGAVYWGIPGRPIKEYLEGLANVGQIPKLRAEIEGRKKG